FLLIILSVYLQTLHSFPTRRSSDLRIYRYIENLIKEGYPYHFVPIMASGVISDNAPPNGRIVEFIDTWNEKHSENIEIEMITLKDRKSTRLNSSHVSISYAVFCLKK